MTVYVRVCEQTGAYTLMSIYMKMINLRIHLKTKVQIQTTTKYACHTERQKTTIHPIYVHILNDLMF